MPAVALALAVVVPVITTISNGLSRDVEARAALAELGASSVRDVVGACHRR